MKIGIIGHGADKFTEKSKQEALNIIRTILQSAFDNITIGSFPGLYNPHDIIQIVSGHSPVGGVDIFVEEIAKEFNVNLDLKIPKQKQWDAEYGFKQRNLAIAKDSDILHVILVDRYPPNYKGMKFKICYHCKTSNHVKSGACWTAKEARKLGKEVIYHIIKNE